jgi:hypothetical protein
MPGWKGVKDGVMTIGEQRKEFEVWLEGLRDQRWAEARAEFLEGGLRISEGWIYILRVIGGRDDDDDKMGHNEANEYRRKSTTTPGSFLHSRLPLARSGTVDGGDIECCWRVLCAATVARLL